MYHPEGILCPTLRFGRSFYPSPKGMSHPKGKNAEKKKSTDARGNFLGSCFLAPFDYPRHFNSEVPSPFPPLLLPLEYLLT